MPVTGPRGSGSSAAHPLEQSRGIAREYGRLVGLWKGEGANVGDGVCDNGWPAERHVGAEQHMARAEELDRAADGVARPEHRGIGVEPAEVFSRSFLEPADDRVAIWILKRRGQPPREVR